MAADAASAPAIWTAEVVTSLVVMSGILAAAYGLCLALLPRGATRWDRFSFCWLVFDGLTHCIIEGSFIFYSFPPGRTVFASPRNVLTESWIECARHVFGICIRDSDADHRMHGARRCPRRPTMGPRGCA